MRRLASGLLVASLLCGCTTSFDVADLPRRDAATVPVDLPAIDAATCGEEGLPCCPSDAGPRCAVGSICSEGRCQRCPGSTSACGGACVDTQTNLTHCGGCDRPCGPGLSCVAGSCALVCPAPLAACGEVCVDLARNPAHCGACNRRCASGEVCVGASCSRVCGASEVRCGNTCVDPATDPANCGSCNNACPAMSGIPRCVNGLCATPGCQPGFAECDGVASTVCETSLNSVNHCGRCMRACNVPNATPACTAGSCGIAQCAEGFRDCDRNPANGCEANTQRDVNNCGTCGVICGASGNGNPGVCAQGSCTTAAARCPPGTAECDGVASTACETRTDTVADCGRCGNRCAFANGTAMCSNGNCTLSACNPGYRDCDGNPANGCEVDLQASVSDCGNCGTVCVAANGTAACVEGRCALGSCRENFGDCDGNIGNGCETDLRASLTDCGRCGATCRVANGSPVCTQGSCGVASCISGRADCDGVAANGCETDLQGDFANCGACGQACVLPNATPRCREGTCVIDQCNEGFGDCDNNPVNGCETDLRTSVQHCGRCREACRAGASASPTCSLGRCGLTCREGFADCNANAADGCEARLACNALHCGACGSACGPLQGCCENRCIPLLGFLCRFSGPGCR